MDSYSKESSAAPARIKIAGAWLGVLEVELCSWRLSTLREAVAVRAGASPERTNLISGGKILKHTDEERSLQELGLKNNAKVLATLVSADRGKSVNEEAAAVADRNLKLSRLRAAAFALSKRHADGSLPVEDFNLELEDQSGQPVDFGSETDRKGAMMGLMLHANAKNLILKEMYKDALDVLSMAEEAFSLCNPKFIEMIDNVPILQLDTVWCYFMLRDISCLSVAGVRLAKARKGFERSHGKDSIRFRLLQSGRYAELAIYLRLELLEGVVAYHSGNYQECRKALNSAQAKYNQLLVKDETLSLLMSMGYKEREAKRALRMAAQDVPNAVDFLIEERAKKMQRRDENRIRQIEIMEQKTFGKTPQNKAVDLKKLNELVSLGFAKYLAAEALRVNENDSDKALDLLTDPEKNCNLQQRLESQKLLLERRATSPRAEESLSRSAVASHTRADTQTPVKTTPTDNSDQQIVSSSLPVNGEGSSANAEDCDDDRDEAMEDELAKELKGDSLADYDLEVTKEGEAIKEYLALLESANNASKGSQ